uniref:Uncharacterized protein n=1 Tax=Oryza punctata TaxID=4537 RepID=A0A0E0MH46_ORYPU
MRCLALAGLSVTFGLYFRAKTFNVQPSQSVEQVVRELLNLHGWRTKIGNRVEQAIVIVTELSWLPDPLVVRWTAAIA